MRLSQWATRPPWPRFDHLAGFIKAVYSPGLHFGFAFAWCLALQGSLDTLFRKGRPGAAISPWRPNGLSGLEITSLFLVLFESYARFWLNRDFYQFNPFRT